MTPLEMIYQIMMDQGVTAGLLIILIFQQNKMNTNLLKKICELQNFIMSCLDKELTEEHNRLNLLRDKDVRLE